MLICGFSNQMYKLYVFFQIGRNATGWKRCSKPGVTVIIKNKTTSSYLLLLLSSSVLLLLLVIVFMQGIDNYKPETHHVSRV
jgi:hypothetical protein